MIKNKQVNLWRGDDPPPTLYHIWFKDEQLLLRYDEEVRDWVVFLDSGKVAKVIAEFIDTIDNLSINGHPISLSPVLNGSDLKVGQSGHYINLDNTLQLAALKFDSLLTTERYEQ